MSLGEWRGRGGPGRQAGVTPVVGSPTWPAELAVLLLLPGVDVHAPGVEGEGEEVLQAGGGPPRRAQPLQPLLALLQGGELAPAGGGDGSG